MCVNMISRKILFTVMCKTLKMCFISHLIVVWCMIRFFFNGFFFLITVAPNYFFFKQMCPHLQAFLWLYRAEHVRWLYIWLDKPIKPFFVMKARQCKCLTRSDLGGLLTDYTMELTGCGALLLNSLYSWGLLIWQKMIKFILWWLLRLVSRGSDRYCNTDFFQDTG